MYVARLSPSASPSASASPSSAVDFTKLEEELWASAADKHEHEELRCVELKEDVAAALDRLEKETGASVMPYARAVVEWYGARLFAEFGSDVDNDSKTNSGSLAGPRVLERESCE